MCVYVDVNICLQDTLKLFVEYTVLENANMCLQDFNAICSLHYSEDVNSWIQDTLMLFVVYTVYKM